MSMTHAASRAVYAARGRGLYRCEICRAPETEASHRIGRAQGGQWVAPNILALCHDCHMWLTEHRDAANAGGWILKDRDADADPTEAPVFLRSAGLWDGWFLLDDRGDAHPLDDDRPPPAVFPPTLTA